MSDLEIHSIDYFLDSNSYRKIFIYLYLFIDIKVLYAIAYMIFALLGIFAHNFFFSFHLIEFIISQPILQYVFRAIVDPIAQLAYTFIFFFILIYFYSLIIFYNFQEIMPENSCNSPVICMAYIYSNTFTSGGNLGNFIDDWGNPNKDGNMVRYALDITYTIIMVWLVWQMVSGLIVDTFESLRGIREDKETDMKTSCFICGLDKEKIEKYYPGKEGFEKHLQDHSIINYFFYTFYLEDKDSSEYSGLESYIKNQIDKESILWFPKERSLKIEEWDNKHKGTHDS
jgi:inositol 1,4,5-triphosphate receptor type 1/inositol 1,4,5-triphosphate receptor type 3